MSQISFFFIFGTFFLYSYLKSLHSKKTERQKLLIQKLYCPRQYNKYIDLSTKSPETKTLSISDILQALLTCSDYMLLNEHFHHARGTLALTVNEATNKDDGHSS